MLPLRDQKTVYQSPKCYFTYGTMPHVDPNQPPSKGKPWSTLDSRDFIYQVELLMPQEFFKLFKAKALDGAQPPEFKRVIMTLGQVLEKEFFREYIRIGNILMLSEGRLGQDNVFQIKDGKLTMFLDKETYERAGIVGETHGVKGNRSLKPRWVVEYDLRAPSSLPGRKGFDRLLYATKNALNFPITWLFCNLAKTPDPDPLEAHFPTKFTSNPAISQGIPVLVPSHLKASAVALANNNSSREDSERFATQVYEWLSLVRLQSPRVAPGDAVDPYLSRYQVPMPYTRGDDDDDGGSGAGAAAPKPAAVCKVTWRGLLSAAWTQKLLVDALGTLPGRAWVALSVSTFASSKGLVGDGTECTFFRPPDAPGEYLQWEIKGHE